MYVPLGAERGEEKAADWAGLRGNRERGRPNFGVHRTKFPATDRWRNNRAAISGKDCL